MTMAATTRSTAKQTTRTKTASGKESSARKSPAKKQAAGRTATRKPSAKRSAAAKSMRAQSAPAKAVPAKPGAAAGSDVDRSEEWHIPPPTQRIVERQWPSAPLRRGLGVALLGLAGADRFTSGHAQVVPGVGAPLPAQPAFDVLLGALDIGLEAGERVSGALARHVNPVLLRAWAPASGTVGGVGGSSLRLLGALTQPLAERGQRLRADSEYEAAAAVAAVLPETIQLVMEQLDLTDLAITHVDIDRVLHATADQVDLTGFAIDNIDLARVIEASLDAVDFTGVAISRLDFARAVTAALDQVDVLSVARDQLDPARVTAYLRENVDVTDTLLSAPGAVAGEAVRGVRGTVGRITGRR